MKLTDKQLLLGTFGVASAVVGAGSLGAHLWNGSVTVTQVLLYTLVFPSLVTAGVWLMRKAKLSDEHSHY